ncbi:DNA ligase 4 [Cannabis sativa]|uniref:DNA ligase n=1 Tax=Cannabis sativa TaxID=3483 RepID=A0A803Q812_CANSA|nr:DNA ligase 4 [Cannabis sativa]
MAEETKFSVLCSLFNWMLRSKTSAKKRSKFRKFLDNFCKPADYFSAVRLILPNLDRERGSYGLKESVLATSLIDALGMARDSPDALRLINWRKGGAKTGANAGNFALVAVEVLERRQGMTSGGLTIRELNELLDRLASCENRSEKISVLAMLIKKTNAQEMKWIIMIILKDLKLGISEKSIFHEFHPDAEDLFNVTCDLKLVCEKLSDRSQRHKRQDIEVGKAVRPQLAMRVADATVAWKKLHGKEVVVECKFDGDRIQIHKNGTEIHYFSRNFLDHSEYGHAMSDVIVRNVTADRCILDGEMLVWDTSLNRFAEFGSNQEIAKAAREGFDSDRQLCYVAFDILYVGDTSVIHQSLKERHELLQKIVKPLKGRLEFLVPNGGTHYPPGEACWSRIAHNVDDVERFFKETIENRDEGIVLKDLGSKWEPSDRSGKWLKLKPDYVRAGSDLDVLIVGGYYGSGRRGGEVAQFLVGLAERPAPNTHPRRFISFCRVGTGLSDEELDAVVNKLKPYFRKYDYPKKAPPNFYHVTNNSKERPDVWIDSPEKSIILSITSDIRTIRSEVFAAPYSLRFPRIDRVRYDKPWHECLDVQSFIELVQTGNGTTHKGTDSGGVQQSKKTFTKPSTRKGKRNLSAVPSHLVRTDISGVKEDTLIFSGMMFYFANVPPTHSLESFHKVIAENGGTFSMNLNSSVTHCVAAESKGIKYQAAKRQGDIVHYSWVLDCCSQRKLIPLQPKYYLFLSDFSKKKLQEDIDEFSDTYYWDLDLADIKQLLSNVNGAQHTRTTDHYKKKHWPPKWSYFHDCFIYFYAPLQYLKPDWEVVLGLALRRLKVEVQMNGGRVSNSLAQATHLVIFFVPGCSLDVEDLLKSFNAMEKRILRKRTLHIVESQWLDDCAASEQRLPEETYSLKHMLEQQNDENCEYDMDLELDPVENQALSCSSKEDEIDRRDDNDAPKNTEVLTTLESSRKRGRFAGKSIDKRKPVPKKARRTRPHIGNKPAKISGNESDSVSHEENILKEENKQMMEDDKKSSHINKARAGPNKVRRTRARTGKRPAKLSCNESDDDVSHEVNSVKEESKQMEQTHELIHKSERVEEPQSAVELKEIKQGEESFRHEEWFNKVPEYEMTEKFSCENIPQQKLEVLTDPVHAMLLDMIPSLGKPKSATTTTNLRIEDDKPPMDINAAPITSKLRIEDDKRLMDVNAAMPPAEPKRKKVSYRDLASELLKD